MGNGHTESRSYKEQTCKDSESKKEQWYQFVFEQQSSFQTQKQIYEFRKKGEKSFVPIVDYQSQIQQNLCKKHFQIKVFVLSFPHRLHNSPLLPKTHSLALLVTLLNSFKLLTDYFNGFFSINSKMIAFHSGQTLIWLNQNFACNYPKNLNITSEDQMVRQIFNLVELKTQGSSLPPNLYIFLQSRLSKPLGFSQTIQLVQFFQLEFQKKTRNGYNQIGVQKLQTKVII